MEFPYTKRDCTWDSLCAKKYWINMNYSLLTNMKQMAKHDQSTSLPDSDQQWAIEMSKSASQVSTLWKIMAICNIVNRKHARFIIHFEKKEILLHCSDCSSISFVLRSIFSFLWNWIWNLTYSNWNYHSASKVKQSQSSKLPTSTANCLTEITCLLWS